MLSTDFVPGVPNWVDLGSPDIDRSAAFYGSVLGWNFSSLGPETGNYGSFQQDGKTVAALGPLEAGQRSAWIVYFSVPDADATTKAVEAAGRTVRLAPIDLPGNARMAQFTDPGGAQFAVLQAAGESGGLDVVSDPGSLGWVELHVADPKAAEEFYASSLGWTAQATPMGDADYTLFSPASGGGNREFGGVWPLEEGLSPQWLVYFEIDDIDAAVARGAEAGGTVVMPVTDLEDVGRMAWLDDPFGARFALIQSIRTT